ncbi:MAG TPA: chromosome partitioning protein, partial [Alphaproteobacteria bacterium]|nr:chromosome partitioning protein [Alphaproteobacteria bacterium]
MITVIGNLKGGCGKSTITFNLAVWLAVKGCNVICFDLDPQSTLSDVNEVRMEEGVTPELKIYRPDSNPTKIMRQHVGEVL